MIKPYYDPNETINRVMRHPIRARSVDPVTVADAFSVMRGEFDALLLRVTELEKRYQSAEKQRAYRERKLGR